MYFIERINVTGRDQAGLTAMLTDRLAGANVMILDMGQAVIHDFLTLGLMIRCETGREGVIDDLARVFHEGALSYHALECPKRTTRRGCSVKDNPEPF